MCPCIRLYFYNNIVIQARLGNPLRLPSLLSSGVNQLPNRVWLTSSSCNGSTLSCAVPKFWRKGDSQGERKWNSSVSAVAGATRWGETLWSNKIPEWLTVEANWCLSTVGWPKGQKEVCEWNGWNVRCRMGGWETIYLCLSKDAGYSVLTDIFGQYVICSASNKFVQLWKN